MDGELARLVAEQRGFFFRAQALDCGYSEREVATLLRARDWVRIRRGAYAERTFVESLDVAGRHVLTVRAVVAALAEPVVVTNHSALAVQGVPLWGVDLGEVHVHRGFGQTSRREAGVVHHLGDLPDDEILEVDGLLVTVAERSVIDSGRVLPFGAGVVLADGAKHALPFDADRAAAILERQRDWTGSMSASRALLFSDGRAATVGESRCRVMMARLGLPAPTLQQPICGPTGALIGTTDLYIEQYQTAVEFDGRQKYGRALYERTQSLTEVDLGAVVWEEKRREDQIRDEGHEMVRIVWSELDGRDHTVRTRFLRAFARQTRRRPGA